MKILQVIHGYPMRYNAGSEVYTQGLCQALAERNEVHVFTRQENAFLPEYALQREADPADPRIALHLINMARARDGYSHRAVDEAFAGLLDQLQPDVVHVGHLNHLSTSLVFPAKERGIPVVFTLHDYWLMCPRGQFIQMYNDLDQDPWPVCDGQDDRKCAVRCYRRYFGNDADEYELDAAYWTGWVGRRMAHARRVSEAVDLFIAPARYLLERFRDDFGIPEGKLTYLDYGFHRDRLTGRSRRPDEAFTFGYYGQGQAARPPPAEDPPQQWRDWHPHSGQGGEPSHPGLWRSLGPVPAAHLGEGPGRGDGRAEAAGGRVGRRRRRPRGVDG